MAVKDDLPGRAAFPHFQVIPTRWMDNDVYGHVNNVVYYSFFDTVVNTHLVEQAGLDPASSEEVGLVVETGCRYFSEITYPQTVEAGMRVTKLGNSSVVYEIGLFVEEGERPSALGRFVHVYVDRESRETVRVPDRIRQALAPLMQH